MAFTSCNMQGIKSRSVLLGNSLSSGMVEKLLHDMEMTLFGGSEQRGLTELVLFVDEASSHLRNLGVEIVVIAVAESPHNLRFDVEKDLPHGADVAPLRRQVQLRVVVPPRHLLHVLLPPRLVDALPRVRQHQRRRRRGGRRRRRRYLGKRILRGCCWDRRRGVLFSVPFSSRS